MSKTNSPTKEQDGIRFIPANGYSPNHWMAKHLVYGFNGFDTKDEGDAANKAILANAIARSFEGNGNRGVDKRAEMEILIKAIFKIVGFPD
jgi:hypothetical protein